MTVTSSRRIAFQPNKLIPFGLIVALASISIDRSCFSTKNIIGLLSQEASIFGSVATINKHCPSAADDWNSNKTVTDEFPYPLTCKKSELYKFLQRNNFTDCTSGQHKRFKVAVTYHVGMVKNWKIIVEDQMATLNECGLLGIAEKFMISYSNANESDLFQVLDPLLQHDGIKDFTDIVQSTKSPWEGPAMNMIHHYCSNQTHPESTIVFYIHNKGASKWESNWKKHMDASATWTYAHSLYWRKYLEYYLIERPALCLEKILLHGASTCGVNWHHSMKNHYSGNFWSATCKHIQRLKPMTDADANYVAAEMWLGKYPGPRVEHANLNYTLENLYLHVIKPEEYMISESYSN